MTGTTFAFPQLASGNHFSRAGAGTTAGNHYQRNGIYVRVPLPGTTGNHYPRTSGTGGGSYVGNHRCRYHRWEGL